MKKPNRMKAILFLVASFILMAALTASAQSPTVTSFNSDQRAGGNECDDHGTNLTGASCGNLQRDGLDIGRSEFDHADHSDCTRGATSGQIAVTTPGGIANTSLLIPSGFTVIPPPTVTSFAPTSGAVGTSVTDHGTNFGAIQGPDGTIQRDGGHTDKLECH